MSTIGAVIAGKVDEKGVRQKPYKGVLSATILTVALGLAAGCAQAAIPSSERVVLDAFYNQTNGSAWTNNTGWEGASGTECSWFGITCDSSSSHVTQIALANNALAGTLPDLSGLSELTTFIANFNGSLTGPIPPLSALTHLQGFYVNIDNLTGPLPTLTGLTELEQFAAGSNQLTGTLPSLAGLNQLNLFSVGDNLLTGTVPVPPASLSPGASSLCPNSLTPAASPETATDRAWDAATGISPWSTNCTAAVTPPPPPPPPIAVSAPASSWWSLLLLWGSLAYVGLLVHRDLVQGLGDRK